MFEPNPAAAKLCRKKLAQLSSDSIWFNNEISVTAITPDQYFVGKLQPDLLWIDVESVEMLVFRGATNVLRGVSLMHVEVSFRPMRIGKPLF